MKDYSGTQLFLIIQLFFLKAGSHYDVLVSLGPAIYISLVLNSEIHLPLPSKCWNYRCAIPDLALVSIIQKEEPSGLEERLKQVLREQALRISQPDDTVLIRLLGVGGCVGLCERVYVCIF